MGKEAIIQGIINKIVESRYYKSQIYGDPVNKYIKFVADPVNVLRNSEYLKKELIPQLKGNIEALKAGEMTSNVTLTEEEKQYINDVSAESIYSKMADLQDAYIAEHPDEIAEAKKQLEYEKENGIYFADDKFNTYEFLGEIGRKSKLDDEVVNLNLFPEGSPKREDVIQTHDNACFLLAPLADIAEKNPKMIQDMIKDNKDGTATVTFYTNHQGNRIPFKVRVDKTLPGLDSPSAPWVRIIEKAFAASRLARSGGVQPDASSLNRQITLDDIDGAEPWISMQSLMPQIPPTEKERDSVQEELKESIGVNIAYQKFEEAVLKEAGPNTMGFLTIGEPQMGLGHVVSFSNVNKDPNSGEVYVTIHDQQDKFNPNYTLSLRYLFEHTEDYDGVSIYNLDNPGGAAKVTSLSMVQIKNQARLNKMSEHTIDARPYLAEVSLLCKELKKSLNGDYKKSIDALDKTIVSTLKSIQKDEKNFSYLLSAEKLYETLSPLMNNVKSLEQSILQREPGLRANKPLKKLTIDVLAKINDIKTLGLLVESGANFNAGDTKMQRLATKVLHAQLLAINKSTNDCSAGMILSSDKAYTRSINSIISNDAFKKFAASKLYGDKLYSGNDDPDLAFTLYCNKNYIDIGKEFGKFAPEKELTTAAKSNKTIQYIDVALKMFKDDAEHDFLHDFSQYKRLVSSLSTPDSTGALPKMTPQTIQRLCFTITSGIANANNYLKTKPSSGIATMLKDVRASLQNDLETIKNTINVYDVNVTELLAPNKKNVINANALDGTFVGAATSRRMAFELPNGKKGFFTEAKTSDPIPLVEQSAKMWKSMFPGFDNAFDAIANEMKEAISNSDAVEFMRLPFNVTEKSINFQNQKDSTIFEALNASKNSVEIVAAIRSSFATIKKVVSNQLEAGIDKNTRIDTRNVAMSSIADLLGCGNILARSIPLTIHSANGDIEGTFMEFADGEDFERLNADSPLLQANQDSYKGPGLKSAVDMGVLDYICANMDRHNANCFYKMSPDGKTFEGLIGIDNDDSFGKETVNNEGSLLAMKNSIKVMSRGMANTISFLTKGQVEACLTNSKLEPDEIDAVYNRITKLKESIRNKEIRVIEDFEWKEMTVDKLGKDNSKPVRHVNAMSKRPIEELENKIVVDQKKLIHATSNYSKSKTDYRTMAQQLKIYCDGLDKVNKGLFVGSKEFDNMLKMSKYVQKQYENMSREELPLGIDEDVFNKSQHERSSAMLSILRDVTSMYIDHKNMDNTLDNSNTARGRVMSAMNLRQFVVENTPKEDLPDRDFYVETAYKDRVNAYKQISPKDLKTRIDNLIKVSKNDRLSEATKIQAENSLGTYLQELKTKSGLIKPKDVQNADVKLNL